MHELTCKLAHQTFASTHVANDASARNTLEDILAVPCHEMSVVDDVLLAFSKLLKVSVERLHKKQVESRSLRLSE